MQNVSIVEFIIQFMEVVTLVPQSQARLDELAAALDTLCATLVEEEATRVRDAFNRALVVQPDAALLVRQYNDTN